MNDSKKLALSGVLCALAVVIMSLGGLIPLATFCAPALAGVLLIPIFVECGEKLTYAAYVAVAALSLMLCPDKEAALLFAFLGHYPALRWRIEQLRGGVLRFFVRLFVFNAAIAAAYALLIWVFRLESVLTEYETMNTVMLLITVLLGNLTLFLYDRALHVMTAVYVNRIRGKLMK